MTVVIIAGHHRSGTSMLARMLHHAGLVIGDELMPGGPSNPFGHYEDMEAVRIHTTILNDNGFGWQLDTDLIPVVNPDVWGRMAALKQNRDGRFPVWGFKDPRVSVFLPLWKHVVPDARIVAVYRHPSACVESIRSRAKRSLRDGTAQAEEVWPLFTQPDLALRLWLVSNAALVRAADAFGDDVVLVSHESLLAGAPLVRLLNERWALNLDPQAGDEAVDGGVVSASVGPLAAHDHELRAAVDETWSKLTDRTPDVFAATTPKTTTGGSAITTGT